MKLNLDRSNANKGTERGRELLKNSLAEHGAGRSILVDKDGNIIAGNKTFEQAHELGMRVRVVKAERGELIAVQRDDLALDDPTGEARQLAYADNRVAEIDLAWEAEQLAADLEAGIDLNALGFDEKSLKDILGELYPGQEADAEPQFNRAEELLEKWQVKTGDLWEIGAHRLLCGDCTVRENVERLMEGEKAGACVTDPPYGQNQKGVPGDNPENLTELLTGAISTIPCENAVVIAFSSPRTFPAWLDITRQAGWKFERMLWLYKQAQEVYPWQGWLLKSEAILVSSIGKPEFHTPKPCNHDCYVLSEVSNQIRDGGNKKHPGPMWHGSIKPLSVVQSLIEHTTGVVYEPFCGSGTTIVAAENLKRRCYAMEISPAYCAVILERMKTAFPELEIRRAG